MFSMEKSLIQNFSSIYYKFSTHSQILYSHSAPSVSLSFFSHSQPNSSCCLKYYYFIFDFNYFGFFFFFYYCFFFFFFLSILPFIHFNFHVYILIYFLSQDYSIFCSIFAIEMKFIKTILTQSAFCALNIKIKSPLVACLYYLFLPQNKKKTFLIYLTSTNLIIKNPQNLKIYNKPQQGQFLFCQQKFQQETSIRNSRMSSSHKKNCKKQTSNSSKKNFKQTSQHSSITKTKLIQFILKTSQLERKLQIIKQMLCQEQDFTPASLFHRLDVARKSFVVQKDIYDFLVDNKITFKGSQLKLLYGKMNSNLSDGGINLREFQNFILPNQNPRLRYFTMRRPIFIPLQHQKLSQKVQWIVSKLFSQIMIQKVKLMQYNTALISSFDFDAQQVFEYLSNDNGFVTGQSLNRFMNQQNIEVNVEEIGCLIKIMDKKGEGRIHLDDFKHYLATLGLKRQHQIFDQLSPVPALKNYQNTQLAVIKDRDSTLYERYLDNKMYAKQFQHAQLGRSRKSGLSRSRRNY